MARTAFWFALAALTALAACAVPRNGPTYAELVAAPPPDLPFDVVLVTAAVASATRIDERMGFDAAFGRAAPEDTATLVRGDLVSITVWENIDQGLLNPQGIGASTLPQARVDADGMVFVPYVGAVRAAGRTPAALRETIRARLADKTLNPQVEVTPLDARGRMISVQGRVRAPGLYPIEDPTTRLLPMLARAGGTGEDPEVILLHLRRGAATGRIWLQDLYDDPVNNVALRPGDAIIAERDRRVFTALGAVGRPAAVPFPSRALSVERAMGAVGGLVDAAADPTGAFVLREEPAPIAAAVLGRAAPADPRRIAYIVDLTQPGGLFLAREFMMRDGDTLYVTSAPFTQWTKVLQSLSPFVTFTGAAKTLSTGY